MSHKALIVGLGQIGMGYDLQLDADEHVYSHARALSAHSQFDLLGAVDPNQECRKIFEHVYARPAYESLETALRAGNPDVVVIASPTRYHGEALDAVLKHSKPRAILCEKPLSTDVAEAEAMLAACAERNIDVYVNYIRRCEPGVIEVKRRLDAGEITTPLKGVVWYSKGLQHNGSHFLNLLEYWLGPMRDASLLSCGRLWEGSDPEPDVRVVFERGEIVFLAAWEECFSHYTVELLAPNGRLRYERGGRLIEWQGTTRDAKLSSYTTLNPAPETLPTSMERYQWHVAEQLARATAGQLTPLCTGHEALCSLKNVAKIIALSASCRQ